MSAWAKPGVKCVCVDNTDHPELIVGGVYSVVRVKAALPASYRTQGKFSHSTTWVEVAEAKNWSIDPTYALERFRPLITKSQEDDVALFRSLLDALPVGESA